MLDKVLQTERDLPVVLDFVGRLGHGGNVGFYLLAEDTIEAVADEALDTIDDTTEDALEAAEDADEAAEDNDSAADVLPASAAEEAADESEVAAAASEVASLTTEETTDETSLTTDDTAAVALESTLDTTWAETIEAKMASIKIRSMTVMLATRILRW